MERTDAVPSQVGKAVHRKPHTKILGWLISRSCCGTTFSTFWRERRTKRFILALAICKGVTTQREDTMIDSIKKFIRDDEGQDLVEYALLLVFLALAAIAILPTLGSSVNRVFSQSNSSLNAS